ncbi:MAG: hypothetical protein HY275_00045 [Gemmatimonadetes bacterium]|nr:hypothetical protein [Gemmatimonadota bacterium]
MRRLLTCLAACALAAPGRAQQPAAPAPDIAERAEASAAPVSAQEAARWRADLQVLATEVPKRHREAFAHLTRATWDSATRALDARIPALPPHRIAAEFMRLVALLRDGHSSLTPEFQPRLRFHRLPVEFHDFADGLFIRATDSAHAELAGARVVRIGRATAAEALTAIAPYVSHEGPQWVRLRGARLLAMPEMVHAAGLSDDPRRVTLTLDVRGQARTVTLEGAPLPDFLAHGGVQAALPVDMREAGQPAPLHQAEPERNWWYRVLDDGTLFIEHRGVQVFADGMLNEEFFRRAFAAGDSANVTRVVLDLRANGGGNNGFNRFVVKEIVRRPGLDRRDRLFVLIGRQTFSAAQNLVNELAHYTNATFVGEPTGNAPNQYGDARPLTLPHSGLLVMVSSLLWEGHEAFDTRVMFTPHVYVEATSADYRAGRDPVLAAAREAATAPPLASQLATLADRGDSAGLRTAIAALRADTRNRYLDVQAEVNRAGYDMLRVGRTAPAVVIFTANAAAFPASANAHDSLGEALLAAGRRDDAIAAYRRALAVDPGWRSARAALERLGARP